MFRQKSQRFYNKTKETTFVFQKNFQDDSRKFQHEKTKIPPIRGILLLSEEEFDVTVAAFDFSDCRIVFPFTDKLKFFPLCFCSLIMNINKARTSGKGIVANALDGIGQGDLFKLFAITEHTISNGCNGIGKGYGCKVFTIVEHTFTKICDGIGNHCTFKMLAPTKSVVSNGGERVRKGYF